MKLSFQSAASKAIAADVVATFIRQDKTLFTKEMKSLEAQFGGGISDILKAGDFSGKIGETALAYPDRGSKTPRVLLVGLGENIPDNDANAWLERYRRAAAAAAKRAYTLKAKRLALALPSLGQRSSDGIVAFAEGAALALYKFDKYITKNENNKHVVESIVLCSQEQSVKNSGVKSVAFASAIVEGTYRARDLSNAPGNEIYPETLAKTAQETGRRSGFKVTVFDEKRIKSLGMGGIIGVCKGSARQPRFIILEYKKAAGQPVVLVGKGVTFDTGGISIKPSASMGEMKMDMSGAAAVIGTFEAVAKLKLPVNIVGLIPAVENMPSGTATRPGDILRHYNGKTSEVDNTDAEGRLILADALGYAERYNPAAVIDLATLTGACVVALGHVVTGLMGNDEVLMQKLKSAGEKTYERVWPLPLFDEYEKLIKSDVADVKNVGGRWAGAITAGWFLKKFIGNYKWAHLDIAGTAILEEKGDYTQRGGSGVGVRLLTEYLRNWK
ncbi:MAG: leucyl aminopeptidase [Ignavibacteriae bacterium]|nr:leucyl aminopeptidase [Ignavibacteriota bacterium]